MNSADMFYASLPKKNIVIYNRDKTEGRRNDDAEMRVKIENCINELMKKYNDEKKLFRFYRHYSDANGFNKALNKGLKQNGEDIGIDV